MNDELSLYDHLPEGKVPADFSYDADTDTFTDRETGQVYDAHFRPVIQWPVEVKGEYDPEADMDDDIP